MYIPTVFSRAVGLGLAEKVTFKQRLEVLGHAGRMSWGRAFQAERERQVERGEHDWNV